MRRDARLACAALAGLASLALLAGCERENRRFSPTPNETPQAVAPRTGALQPGAPQGGNVKLAAQGASPYDDNAYAVAQGKRLFRWYNCSGCHANGGGGMGPALMDSQWLYGSEPAQIFETIMRGRPNGMPSFAGHVPEDQVWQIVAYVRSMSGQLRKDVAPSRSDTLYPGPAENARPPETPQAAAPPEVKR
jgi:cytochrome c oxidase cbb3-type subunit III